MKPVEAISFAEERWAFRLPEKRGNEGNKLEKGLTICGIYKLRQKFKRSPNFLSMSII
ncbi:hypothetical protein PO124_28510 [Bacillus licheniformis]|nr:hypothetical protein [Bacillus licheniformis]